MSTRKRKKCFCEVKCGQCVGLATLPQTEPIAYTMWDQRSTILWASKACYGNSFTLLYFTLLYFTHWLRRYVGPTVDLDAADMWQEFGPVGNGPRIVQPSACVRKVQHSTLPVGLWVVCAVAQKMMCVGGATNVKIILPQRPLTSCSVNIVWFRGGSYRSCHGGTQRGPADWSLGLFRWSVFVLILQSLLCRLTAAKDSTGAITTLRRSL
jgi:hypothetical protein